MRRSYAIGLVLLLALGANAAKAEDGHEAWLRYHALPAAQIARYAPLIGSVQTGRASPTLDAAARELTAGITGLLGQVPGKGGGEGAVMIGTPASSSAIAALHLSLAGAGKEGFLLRSQT